ncbi:hypothetical protein [Tunturiibacter gelidoferens]|uniref:Uncharacterized protein n=1 Tax=Tunturiibacter gelidiferens TaxID=3069689 RepID=A0ACC5NZU6_9BACT|nr:hypothetical protein [Edaphobacter lichenicola]MBB5339954.1 hypothetical protein [Edaphobacter lichenicola]
MAEQRKYERGIIAGRDKLVADSTETGDRHENTANAPTAKPIVGKHCAFGSLASADLVAAL